MLTFQGSIAMLGHQALTLYLRLILKTLRKKIHPPFWVHRVAHRRKLHAVGEGLGVQLGVDLVNAYMVVNKSAEIYSKLIEQESCVVLQEHRGGSNAPAKLTEQLLNALKNPMQQGHSPWPPSTAPPI